MTNYNLTLTKKQVQLLYDVLDVYVKATGVQGLMNSVEVFNILSSAEEANRYKPLTDPGENNVKHNEEG